MEPVIIEQNTETLSETSKKSIETDHEICMVDVMATKNSEADSNGKSFKYPYYPLSSALKLATAVKDLGGGRTPVKKSLLAKHIGTSESAAAFAQGLTSAKVFGVVDGHGDYSLTENAKRYFFPTTESDKSLALLDTFGKPAAFAELLRRFDGDKLPTRDILGNILHRDLGIPDSWKERVAGLFTNAAQEVGVIDSQGYLRYDANRHAEKPVNDPPPPPPDDEDKNRDKDKKDKPVKPGMVRWQYKTIEVLTPETLDHSLWKTLEGYVKLLEPPQ
jgi:hypothetical protein